MSSYRAIITGTGHFVPLKRLTNDDLARMVDTNDEWITQRTGIKERRIAGEGESTATLAVHAATRAMDAAAIEPKDLDLIICATITPEMVTPATACFLGAAMGLSSTPAFDLSAACSGFVYALDTASAMIECGRYRNVLVVGAETISRITDYKDRGSCILFGDGAGAVVLSRGPREGPNDRGVLYTSLHADGAGWEFIYCMPGSRHPVTHDAIQAGQQYIKLRGREVFKFAVTRFVEMAQQAMEQTGLGPDDIKLVVPHQSNARIIEAAMDKLKMPIAKARINLHNYGNTSAASIPIALDEAVRDGSLTKGDVALMIGIGGGLTWSAAMVRL
jgi:3-oxoacyl-[acyl-carrier-protein] synthase III